MSGGEYIIDSLANYNIIEAKNDDYYEQLYKLYQMTYNYTVPWYKTINEFKSGIQ